MKPHLTISTKDNQKIAERYSKVPFTSNTLIYLAPPEATCPTPHQLHISVAVSHCYIIIRFIMFNSNDFLFYNNLINSIKAYF
jgi:hypothetical protein